MKFGKNANAKVRTIMTSNSTIIEQLYKGPVIPAIRSIKDFEFALMNSAAPSLIILFGDINILEYLLVKAEKAKKRLIIHIDLFEGIGKDKAGIAYLARIGVTAIITIKNHLAKIAREFGMIVIQRLFIMDSEALKSGIKIIKHFKPDAIEILPATVPAWVVRALNVEIGLPIFAGSFIYNKADLDEALGKGILAISTHQKDLWP